MPAVIFFTHIPLLRLAGDEIPFADGELTHLAWDDYNWLTGKAFEDFQALYEATAPVFYRVDIHDPEGLPLSDARPDSAMKEISAPSAILDPLLTGVGLGFMSAYANNRADPAWIALLLAAPAAAPVWPRLSLTFLLTDDTVSLAFPEGNFSRVRVDGDASEQLLFSPRAAGLPITQKEVERANALLGMLGEKPLKPEVAAALGGLCGLSHPALSPDQQTTLAVVSLEALLMPEVTKDLRATFARRVSVLLAPEADRKELARVARKLYDARSTGLHGGAGRRRPVDRQALAQQLLAAAIEALLPENDDIATVCARLDEGYGADAPRLVPPEEVAGFQAADRLRGRMPKVAAGFSLGGETRSMAADEGTLLSWSPLVGLTAEVDIRSRDSGAFLTAESPPTVLTLEDKDVRRELGNLLMIETPIACLGVSRAKTGHNEGDVASMLRERDLAVTALRLAGFAAFTDPELLGLYLYDGMTRTIDSSVFSLMILRGMGADPEESLEADDVGRFGDPWRLLRDYDRNARNDEIDHVLGLYRRAHDQRFLAPVARAGLLFATLESMLGPFRARDDPVQLEDLVRRIEGDDPAAIWFKQNGRALRNAIAHGYWDGDEEPLGVLQALLGPVLVALIEAWVHGDDCDRRPSQVLLDSVAV